MVRDGASAPPHHEDQALVPLNGKLPIGPMPISPEMLSPETLPVNSSVSGIGLVMETFQVTSSPFAWPSKISVELPSAACVPVSAPPAFFRLNVALRSPIGVLMMMFQFPSTAICNSSHSCSQNLNGSGIRLSLPRRYSASSRPSPMAAKRDQVRTARSRLVTRRRNATYCTAKAATF